MFPIPILYPNNNTKYLEIVRKEKTYVSLEAEVRLHKLDGINQCCPKTNRGETKWKLGSIVKYDIEGSYYIKVIEH